MRRTAMLLKAFFTGIVEDIPDTVFNDMFEDWRKLTNKDGYLQDIRQQSAARRQSMFETATRSNYLMVVTAFVIAANVTVLVALGDGVASQVLLTISTSMIALAAAILTIAISAKSKVMKKPRKGGEIEPAEMLRNKLAIEQVVKKASTDRQSSQREQQTPQAQNHFGGGASRSMDVGHTHGHWSCRDDRGYLPALAGVMVRGTMWLTLSPRLPRSSLYSCVVILMSPKGRKAIRCGGCQVQDPTPTVRLKTPIGESGMLAHD